MGIKYSKTLSKNGIAIKHASENSTVCRIELLVQGIELSLEADDHQLRHQILGMRDFHLLSDTVVIYYYLKDEKSNHHSGCLR